MSIWIQGAPQLMAAFLGASVEAIEAATIVLAVGAARGWRPAWVGAVAGLATLAAIVAIFGPAIAAIPVDYLQIVVGTFLLLFGIRWLRKAILRSAGVLALHDESAVYAERSRVLRESELAAARWDPLAMLVAYKAVVLEGIEVVVIVIGVGAVGNRLMLASVGALAACALVAAAAALLRRPLARVPENTLKYVVGVMMSAFGLFWFGEGVGIEWPFDDGAIPVLMAVLFAISVVAVRACRATKTLVAAASRVRS